MSRSPVSRADRKKFSGHRELCVNWLFPDSLTSRVVQFLLSPIFWDTHKTVRIKTHSLLFGGKVLTDEKLHDFFNVPKLHPTHRWKRLLPISVSVPS
jgi:hypothetical protein